jgi:fructose 1,6-bisphosphatase
MLITKELERRVIEGNKPKTLVNIKQALANIGYELEPFSRCHFNARWLSGPNAGESYPAISTGIRESDTKLSFAHYEARRDKRFHELQSMRFSGEWYAVIKNSIFEI